MLSLINKLDRSRSNLIDLTFFIANTIEHFDNSLYYFLGSYIAVNFFSSQDFIIQLVMCYSITITTIFTKPLGAILFAAMATNKSPEFSLRYSLNGLAFATLLTGCLPTFNMVGNFAPILLIITRMFFGIFSGGERAIVRLYMMESYSTSKGLKHSYSYDISSIVGIILASLVSTIIIKFKCEQAWRSCFCVAGLLGLLVSLVRYVNLPKKNNNFQISQINFNLIIKSKYLFNKILQYKFIIIKITLASSFSYITYAIPFIFFNNFIPIINNKITIGEILSLNNYLLFFDLLSLFVISKIIDNYDVKLEKILFISSVVLCCTIIPLFFLLVNASILRVAFVSMWIVFWGTMFVGAIHCWFKNLLVHIPERYFLLSIGDSIGSILLGKASISCCFYLWYVSQNIFVLSGYILILMSLAVAAILINPDKS